VSACLIASIPLYRFHRCGQDPVWIAGGHADANRAHVDTEPSAAAGVRGLKTAPGPIR